MNGVGFFCLAPYLRTHNAGVPSSNLGVAIICINDLARYYIKNICRAFLWGNPRATFEACFILGVNGL